MSLKYRLIYKINPQNPTQPGQFFPHPVTRSELTLRQLAEEIAQISTVSIVDTIAVIESFIQLIPKHVTQGDIIRLGDFGSFAIGIRSSGAQQEEQFRTDMIKGLKIYFRPGKELKRALTLTEFEKEQ
jgi:predicted histone-like DNA-binding protein